MRTELDEVRGRVVVVEDDLLFERARAVAGPSAESSGRGGLRQGPGPAASQFGEEEEPRRLKEALEEREAQVGDGTMSGRGFSSW